MLGIFRSSEQRIAATAALLLVSVLLPTNSAAASERHSARPNIVFFLVDDMGFMDIGANNPDTFYETPNIDALAASGMRFTNGYAANPVCSPTRYSIMTGRYNWRSRLKSAGGNGYSTPYIENEQTTIAELFKAQGYQTAIVGKWHLGWDWSLTGEMEQFDDRVVSRREFRT